jgi:ribosomal protein S18 acetylase RimI-like enzyme
MIREANQDDCNNLAALSLKVWLQTYAIDGIQTVLSKHALSTFTEYYFASRLNQENCRLIVDIDGNYLRGYALVNLTSNFETIKNGFEIERLYVDSHFQGRGTGRRLLSDIVTRYGASFWLYTWTRNQSIGFYINFGFKEIGRYNFKFGEEFIENHVLGFNGWQVCWPMKLTNRKKRSYYGRERAEKSTIFYRI